MKVYVMTQKGSAKHENEDRVLVDNQIVSEGYREVTLDSGIIAIADGVGGNNAGAIASSFVCENLKNIVLSDKNVLVDINSQLIMKSTENAKYSGMATTLSGVCIGDNMTSSFHVGNTRIYIFQGSYIKQITEDHTSVNWLIKTGRISPKDAETYDRRNEITACFGGGNPALINSLVFEENNETLSNSKRIVLTSDGIHEYISIDELEDILNNESFEPLNACSEIINVAKANGSNDDKSIVIIDK